MQNSPLIECYNRLVYASREELTDLAKQLVTNYLQSGQALLAEELDPTATYSSIESELRNNTNLAAQIIKSDLEDVAVTMADVISNLEVEVKSVTLNHCGFVSADCEVVDKI